MRVFLDTNIVLDVLLNRPSFVADSEAVILRCDTLGHPMFIAWHGLAPAYYLLKRGRTESEALVELDKLLSWVSVADASDADARAARALGFADFEDALQAVSAEAAGADFIVTRNIADFSKSKIPAINPQEFLQRVSAS
jgi:predicted nucleic acid-binding protein